MMLTFCALFSSPLSMSTPDSYMTIFTSSPFLANMPRSRATKAGAWSEAPAAPTLNGIGAADCAIARLATPAANHPKATVRQVRNHIDFSVISCLLEQGA